MKLKQILFLALISSQTLIYRISAGPVAPSQFVPFDSVPEMQTAMNAYADSIMLGSYGTPYILSRQVLPKWSTAEPAAWQVAEKRFLSNKFAIEQEGVEISSLELLDYLNNAYISYGKTIDQAFSDIKSLSKFTLPEGYSSTLEYMIKNNVASQDVAKLSRTANSSTDGSLPQDFNGTSTPVVSPPAVPTVPGSGSTGGTPTTGTGSNNGGVNAAEQAYDQALSNYQAQVKTTAGLQELQSQLSTLDANVVNIQTKISEALSAETVDEANLNALDEQLTQALADQVAARDAINKADPVEPVDG